VTGIGPEKKLISVTKYRSNQPKAIKSHRFRPISNAFTFGHKTDPISGDLSEGNWE